jgi:hypothetical protein
MSNPLWSPDATSQIPHDIAVSIQALSHQRSNGEETDGMALNLPIGGIN